jgi:hypothetical protein
LALENDGEFKNGFLSLSDKYFKEITKIVKIIKT